MQIPKTWVNIETMEQLAFLREDLEVCKRVVVDTETTGLSVEHKVFGISLAVGDVDGDKAVRRVYWCNMLLVEEDVKETMIDIVRTLFATDSTWNLMFHNASFDIRMLRGTYGIELLHENINCSMLLALLLCRWPAAGLKYLTGSVLGRKPVWSQAVEAFKKKHGFGPKSDFPYTMLPADIIFPYACEDAQNTFDLFFAVLPNYKYEVKELQDIYKLERRVSRVVAQFEFQGMKIDLPYFEGLRERLEADLAEEREYFSERWGTYKNTNKQMVPSIESSDRLGKILFDSSLPDGLKLNVEFATFTPTGRISVKMSDLAANFPDNETVMRIAAYTHKKDALNDFIIPICERHVEWEDGTHSMHTQFWQVQATGRFGSSKINLQNITNDKLAEEHQKGHSIRKGFIHPEGYLYLTADYKAFEVAVLANASQDKVMIQHVLDGIDFHSTVGAIAYHRPYEELRNHVDDLARLQRTKIKKTSFLFIYGGGIKKAVRTNGLTYEEAQDIKNSIREAYPAMMEWWDDTYRTAGHKGKIHTLCGRVRRISPQEAYTKSVNTVCQGTAADIMKYAHADIQRILQGSKSRQVHTVHDEIHFYFHPDDVHLVRPCIKAMETQRFDPPNNGTYVPMIAELSIGPNWSERTEVELEEVEDTLRSMKC
jgi:DNA polymerase I